MVIEIDAIDTLFFRDGKPFSMQEETWADGMFPPNPTVIRGALRSLWFSQNSKAFQSFKNSGSDPTDDLSIKGIALRRRVDSLIEDLLPAPRDMVVTDRDKNLAELLAIEKCPNTAASSLPLKSHFIYMGDKKVTSIESAFLDKDKFLLYLNAQGRYQLVNTEDLITSEPKVGIGRDNTSLTAEEGQLYRVDMKRLKNKMRTDVQTTMLVEFDNLDIPQSGFLKLGGEGKVVAYQKADPFLPDHQVDLTENKCFKIVLLTPAIFENGWRAKWMDDPNTMEITGILIFESSVIS